MFAADGIVIGRTVPGNSCRAKGTIGKVQGVRPLGHLNKLTAIVHIVVCGRPVAAAGPHAVGIVDECAVYAHPEGQSPPGERRYLLKRGVAIYAGRCGHN
jgi:hypothetical protein